MSIKAPTTHNTSTYNIPQSPSHHFTKQFTETQIQILGYRKTASLQISFTKYRLLKCKNSKHQSGRARNKLSKTLSPIFLAPKTKELCPLEGHCSAGQFKFPISNHHNSSHHFTKQFTETQQQILGSRKLPRFKSVFTKSRLLKCKNSKHQTCS